MARATDELRRLAEQDSELAARAMRLAELDRATGAVRSRAEAIDAFFASYPAESPRRSAAVSDARSDLERRRDELKEAEGTLDRAKDDEARDYAHRAVARALDHVAVALARLERAEAEHGELEVDASALPSEVPDLEGRAAAIAAEVDDVPPPGEGPRALIDWSSHAHAELFVATRQLDAQRERIIREANELGTMLLGEPTYGSTPAQVLTRVQAHWTSSPGQVSESK
jgi:chromosome segregation ATPase